MVHDPPVPSGASGVYLHFPFCASRCSYCDFPTVVGRDGLIDGYLDALEREIARFQRELPPVADSVFLGGGTPSRATPGQVARLVRAVRARFELTPDCEVTLECNPESLRPEKLAGFAAAGVNRISVGVQSLDDGVLRRVGRAHDAARGLEAVDAAIALGGVRVNVDLILGLPGEAPRTWPERVARLAARDVDHVSVYLLETDKDTPLARAVRAGRDRLADDESLARAYAEGVAVLAEHGLVQYEISNFARPGACSRHNLKYWTDAWFAGFGLGAHAYLAGRRRANLRDLGSYERALAAGRDPLGVEEPWDAGRRLEEALILGLRLVRGVNLHRLGTRYGVDLEACFADVWTRAGEEGLLEREGPVVRLTPRGRLCSNVLFVRLIGETARFRDADGPAGTVS